MYVFNIVGLMMLFTSSGAVAMLKLFVTETGDRIPIMLGGLLLSGIDLVYRNWRSQRQPLHSSSVWLSKWFHHLRGGQLFFIPMWIWGIVWCVAGATGILSD